ncbi:MAG TPA: FlgD immunoglobulin-like domain containing protein [bacterium]|nr:FlgD immunoglobulin-like domain containing protein [bacterium]
MRIGVLPVVSVLLSAGCLASIASAQTNWARTYGGPDDDEGRSVQQSSDGGYIIAGLTASFGAGNYDVYLIKTNAQGDTLWTRTYGGTGDDEGYSVQQTSDGGYIIAGYTNTFGPGAPDYANVYLIKTDAHGDTLWTRAIGRLDDEVGNSVEQTSDGGYVIAGYTYSFGPGTPNSANVYLIKTNSSGDTLWTRALGGASTDVGNSVCQTADGGFIIAGSTGSFGAGGYDVYLVKTNGQGDTLWTRTYGGTSDDVGNSVQQTTDGGYIIGGGTSSFGPGTPTNSNVYLIKTNAQGDTLWTRVYGRAPGGYGSSVQQTADGGYIIVGATFSQYFVGPGDVYLVKTDSQGDTLWTRTYGGRGDNEGYSVRQAADGGYVVAGYTASAGAGSDDVFLIKTNGVLDVGPVAILSPPGIADSGSTYVPRAVVRNFGLTSGTLPVTMEIGSGYSQTVQETLVSVPQETLAFPAWTAGPVGSVPVTCYTSLAGDQKPANDTFRESIQVNGPPRHDVGAVAILAPPGLLRAGDTAMPKVRIKNFGTTAERLFGVQFRISTGYSRTVTVTQALSPDSTMDLTFSEWVAPPGQWVVSCSTMLASDVNRANDKVSSSVQTYPQSLQIGPDQSDQLQAGQGKTYRFYALVQGDTGGVVEVARPSASAGWNVWLRDAAGAKDLTDTDGDGIPDLGYVAPGESCWFSLDVTASSGLIGDTASLAQRTFLIAGRLGNDTLVADTAVLNLTLMPGFSIHNFPNPFSTSTSFVIGLPEAGKVSLTIYTRAGERVRRLMTNDQVPMTAGVHIVPWDGTNDDSRHVAPGTYEYVLDYEHSGKTDRIHKRLVMSSQ